MKNELLNEISAIGQKYGVQKVVLFGSRARGDNRDRSDIDIAVYGIKRENQIFFTNEIENLPTLLDFDIVFVTDKTEKKLLDNINKDGVVLMSKFDEKYDKFADAVNRLQEAINDYAKNSISSIRDGAIQRYEFCTELAWKTTREYLIDEGHIELNSPKSVMKQAYADNIISDETVWLELLNARNITSHIYDEDTAATIFDNVCNLYLALFKQLLDALK